MNTLDQIRHIENRLRETIIRKSQVQLRVRSGAPEGTPTGGHLTTIERYEALHRLTLDYLVDQRLDEIDEADAG